MSEQAEFPPVLAALHQLEFDYRGGDGIDFEPYDAFMSREDTRSWLRAWTANQQADGSAYRVFGQDGTGGYAAFWRVEPERPLVEQPIVFFGSEGELGVIAATFADYLWLLAGDVGPLEAVSYGDSGRAPNAAFTAFAESHAPGARRSVGEILAAAKAAYPTFEDDIRKLCR